MTFLLIPFLYIALCSGMSAILPEHKYESRPVVIEPAAKQPEVTQEQLPAGDKQ
jgi:hypothetical protein